MGLESATYISGLNSANPTTSDAKTEGDDHIRLIKSTILTTFPNITGAVTATHGAINAALSNSNWSFDTNRLRNTGNTQPSFHASRQTTQTSGTTIIFATEDHDYGSNYDASTGIFTAPVDGVYLFCATVILENTTGSTAEVRVVIDLNGTDSIAFSNLSIPNSADRSESFSVIIKLSATNQVKVVSQTSLSANLFVRNGPYSRFSGRLLG